MMEKETKSEGWITLAVGIASALAPALDLKPEQLEVVKQMGPWPYVMVIAYAAFRTALKIYKARNGNLPADATAAPPSSAKQPGS